MNDHFITRRAGLSDMPALLELQGLAFRHLATEFYDPSDMELALETVPLLTPDLVAEGNYLIHQRPDGTIIAGGGWSRRRPGYADATGEANRALDSHQAIVRTVLVHPDCARRGLGRRMMEVIETDAASHGVSHIMLTATLSGLPLYDAIGYTRLHPEAAELPNGRTIALVAMEKWLSERASRAA